jgi:hypothetical protein
MSSETAVARAPSFAAPAEMDPAATRMALRVGVGVALGFLLGALSGTAFFFLPPLLAVQFLATMRQPPSLRQGIGVVILVALFGGVTLFLAGSFAHRPLVYVILVGLVLFYGFLLDTAGKMLPASLLLTLGATIPLAATQSSESAIALAGGFIGATVIALLTTWAMFAVFPAPAPAPTTAVAPPRREASPRIALANTAVLLPVLVLFMVSGRMTFVLLLVIVAIIRLSDRSASPRAALGLLLGNILGGVVATIAYGFVTVQPSIVFFLLVVLFVGLAFGERIAAAGAQAPVFAIALVAFVILLGLGVSPLPTDSGEAFVARVWNVLLAGAYAIGALSLTASRIPLPAR